MAEKVEEILSRLSDLNRVERIRVLLLVLIELIEREYYLVKRLKHELREYEKEVRQGGGNSDRTA